MCQALGSGFCPLQLQEFTASEVPGQCPLNVSRARLRVLLSIDAAHSRSIALAAGWHTHAHTQLTRSHSLTLATTSTGAARVHAGFVHGWRCVSFPGD